MNGSVARALALAAMLAVTLAGGARAEPPPAGCPQAVEHATAAQLVDLNLADEGALLGLPGIGPARARAILAYRATHGRFRSISELLQIKGIGRGLLKQLRPHLTLGSGAG